MNKTSKQLIKTYKELDKTLDLMQKEKGVTPFIFNKVLNTRSSIHTMIIDSLDNLNYNDITKTLNKIKK
jgi:hypothetical protein